VTTTNKILDEWFAVTFTFQFRIGLILIHAISPKVVNPGFDVPFRNKYPNLLINLSRRYRFLSESLGQHFEALLDGVIVGINDHNKADLKVVPLASICLNFNWIMIRNILLTRLLSPRANIGSDF